MRTLIVLRHAKASPEEAGMTDHDRPLTKKGRKAAKAMGKLLREEGLTPDLVLSSTAERARETTILCIDAARYAGPVLYLDELYLAEPPAYLDALRRHGGDAARVLVVGHNPGLEALLFRLTGRTEHLPTAALATCTLPIERWSELGAETTGELVQVVRPKELD